MRTVVVRKNGVNGINKSVAVSPNRPAIQLLALAGFVFNGFPVRNERQVKLSVSKEHHLPQFPQGLEFSLQFLDALDEGINSLTCPSASAISMKKLRPAILDVINASQFIQL